MGLLSRWRGPRAVDGVRWRSLGADDRDAIFGLVGRSVSADGAAQGTDGGGFYLSTFRERTVGGFVGQQLVAAAAEKWPICQAVIWHRLGEVWVGEASVVIAVSSPHRGEAFDACEFLIDELKKAVPIWKREVYEDGSKWQ